MPPAPLFARLLLGVAATVLAGCSGPDGGASPWEKGKDAGPFGAAARSCPGIEAAAPDLDDDGAAGGSSDGSAACVSSVTPSGVTVLDSRQRVVNGRGVHLVDWDGMVANAAVRLTLLPPRDLTFPATATVVGDHPRLYFDLPSTVSAAGPSKTVHFAGATSAVDIEVGIYPDRDGEDETHTLTLTLAGAEPRPETISVTVHDQDRNLPLLTSITVDFTHDTTGFFDDPMARRIVQQAADDWCYFLDDMRFDPVPALDESTFLVGLPGATDALVTNATTYTGFLVYVYGMHSSELHSFSSASDRGNLALSDGRKLALARSGIVAIETRGNYNDLGWIFNLEPDEWWRSGNELEKNDFLSIVHHELGHAHGFQTGPFPLFPEPGGALCSPALVGYLGEGLGVYENDHFSTVDPASGFGAFGEEYGGRMPSRRWTITRTDLLALEAIGYRLRPELSFAVWKDERADCP